MKGSPAPKSKNVDMTTGPLWNKILIYFMPLLFTTIIQRAFNAMDVAVIGRFAGEMELAAVGCSASLSSVMTNLVAGLATGTTVIVGQLVGSRKEKTAKKAIHNSVLLGFLGGVVIAVLGVIFTRPMLIATSTPEDVLPLATIYLTMIFIDKPFSLTAAFASAAVRSKGDSKSPLICAIVTSITKLSLNIILVAIFKLGIYGVSAATLAASVVNCVTIIICMMKDKSEYRFSFTDMKYDKYILSRIIALGIPSAIQSVLLPFSNIIVQSSYNSLGTTVVAAAAAGSSWESMAFCVTAAFTSTAIAFVSQNYGAKKLERCKKTIYITIAFSTIFTYILDVLILVFKDYTIGMITDDPMVISLAAERLFYTFSGHFFLIVSDQLTSALRGFGKTLHASVIYVCGVCGLRIIWIATVFNHFKTYTSIVSVYPITFIATALVMTIVYIRTYRRLPIHNVSQK